MFLHMIKFLKRGELWTVLLIITSVLYIYKDVFINNRIAFSSNLLASFYSPWATYKFESYPQGIPNKPIGGNDQVRMFYPYRVFINESFAKKQLPLWNPYNFSGSPLLANFQSAVFYPLNLIYFLLPYTTSWSLLVIIQPLLGTLFMYLYLRQYIKHKLAAFFGAFAFGFSGYILAWSQENAVVGQTALWFPLVLLATDRFVKSKNLKNYILLVVSLATCILAGFLQTSFYIFFVSFWYGFYQLRKFQKINIKLVWCYVSAYFLNFMVCAIQLLPSIEAFVKSARSTSSIQPVLDRYLLPFTHYIIAFAPDIFGNPGAYNFFGKGFYHETIFYIGIIPLVFAVLASRLISSNRIIKFFLFVAVISFIFGVKSPFTDWFYTLPIPLVSTFTPSRIFFVTSTALAILSAFGFSYWIDVDIKKIRRIVFITVAVIATILIGYISYHFLKAVTLNNPVIQTIDNVVKPKTSLSMSSIKISGRNLVIPLFMLLSVLPVTFLKKKFRHIKLILIVLLCLGQFYFLNKYLVIGDKLFLYPDHFVFSDIQLNQDKADRFLSFGLPILGDVGLVKHVYSPDGIDPVFPRRYGQLVFATKRDGVFKADIPRIEVNLSEYADNENIIDNHRRHRLMSLLGVSRVYNYEPAYKNPGIISKFFPDDIFTPIWKKNGWQAYENKNALPRAFLVDKYIVERNPQKSMDLIFTKSLDFQKIVVLEEKPSNYQYNGDEEISENVKKVDIEVYEQQKVQLRVNTDVDRILFLSDNYYPGWKAIIDGVPTKIYRANYTFRAIVVPKGEHTVTFQFKPLSFIAGAYISVSTLILFCSVVLLYKFKYFTKRIKI